MSYTPTNWKARDKVTAAKLNKLEHGVSGAEDIFWVTYNQTTSSEIEAALEAGKTPILRDAAAWNQLLPLVAYSISDNQSMFKFGAITGDSVVGNVPCGNLIFITYTRSNNRDFWSRSNNMYLVSTDFQINGKSLDQSITITSGDIEFNNSATYNSGTIGYQVSHPDNNAFSFTAIPEYDNGNLISYTVDKDPGDILSAVISGRTIECFIRDRGRVNPTMLRYASSFGSTSITIIPILTDVGSGDFRPFAMHWSGDYYDGTAIIYSDEKYILPLVSADDSPGPYHVPIMDRSNTYLGIKSINDVIDFGTTIDQLIIGALNVAAQTGQADLSTYIDDSSTVAIADEVLRMCQDDIYNGRGVIAHFQYGLNEFYSNISSFIDQGSYQSVTFLFETTGMNFVGDTFTFAELYSGKITMTVHYFIDEFGTENADYTIGIIHVDKYDAQAV